MSDGRTPLDLAVEAFVSAWQGSRGYGDPSEAEKTHLYGVEVRPCVRAAVEAHLRAEVRLLGPLPVLKSRALRMLGRLGLW